MTGKKLYQEHVTNYIYSHPSLFNIHFETIDRKIENASSVRLTIDTLVDFELAQILYSNIEKKNLPFKARDIVEYVNSCPDLTEKMKIEILKNSK